MKQTILSFIFICFGACTFDKNVQASIIVENKLNSNYLNREIRLWTYLPPNYDANKTAKYDVIYMHDGQNLFYDSLSFAGEWRIDESLDSLYEQTGKQIIVVGIENGGNKRIDELTPYEHTKYGGGHGDAYLDCIAEEIIPYAESKWNISNKPSRRAIWGSSLGGLISFYAAFETDEFSNFGVYSPSFWFSDSIFTLTHNKLLSKNTRMVMTVGMLEEGTHKEVEKMKNILEDNQNIILDTEIVQDGQHSEWFWAREFYDDVQWLFE